MSEREHIAELDGLRAVAIGLVMLHHFTSPDFPGAAGAGVGPVTNAGWIGVDLFFVISGFLITGICLDHSGPGFFRAFYARRALRILPAYALLLGTFGLASFATTGRLPDGFGAMVSFTTNVFVTRAGGFPAVPPMLSHLWSLAVEEQFYILWPLCVALLPRRLAFAIAILAIPSALVVRWWLLVVDHSAIGAYVLMPARMDTLAIGAVLAFVVRSGAWPRWRELIWRLGLCNARLLGIALLVICVGISRPMTRPAVMALQPSAVGAWFGVMTVATISSQGLGSLSWLLNRTSFQWLGTRSYGVYLLHVPVFRAMQFAGLVPRTTLELLAFVAAATIATCVLAELSWRTIEQPALRLKRFVRYSSRVDADLRALTVVLGAST